MDRFYEKGRRGGLDQVNYIMHQIYASKPIDSSAEFPIAIVHEVMMPDGMLQKALVRLNDSKILCYFDEPYHGSSDLMDKVSKLSPDTIKYIKMEPEREKGNAG